MAKNSDHFGFIIQIRVTQGQEGFSVLSVSQKNMLMPRHIALKNIKMNAKNYVNIFLLLFYASSPFMVNNVILFKLRHSSTFRKSSMELFCFSYTVFVPQQNIIIINVNIHTQRSCKKVLLKLYLSFFTCKKKFLLPLSSREGREGGGRGGKGLDTKKILFCGFPYTYVPGFFCGLFQSNFQP